MSHTISMDNQTTPMMTDEAMADLYARRMDKQVYASEVRTKRKRLDDVTWCYGDKPSTKLAKDLLWCDKRKGR